METNHPERKFDESTFSIKSFIDRPTCGGSGDTKSAKSRHVGTVLPRLCRTRNRAFQLLFRPSSVLLSASQMPEVKICVIAQNSRSVLWCFESTQGCLNNGGSCLTDHWHRSPDPAVDDLTIYRVERQIQGREFVPSRRIRFELSAVLRKPRDCGYPSRNLAKNRAMTSSPVHPLFLARCGGRY